MSIHQIATTILDDKIYNVAVSIQGVKNGDSRHSALGGETFVYTKNEEMMALNREYFDNVWSMVQKRVTEVKLGKPERMPTVLRLEKGSIVISSGDIGVIIPIRNPDDTFEGQNFTFKSRGSPHRRDAQLAPHTIIVLFGDRSEDVSLEMPASVAFDLILHPKSILTPLGE